MKDPKSLDDLIAMTKASLASEELTSEQRKEAESFCRTFEEISLEERESLDHFFVHMPDEHSDLTLIVLKGHLLLEQRVREFIGERMLSPKALDSARLSFFQLVCLAEALTFPNEDPKRMWDFLRKLNSLRNQLAHDLVPIGIEERVQEIISDYSSAWAVHSSLINVLAHAYGQLSELGRLARKPPFQILGRESKP